MKTILSVLITAIILLTVIFIQDSVILEQRHLIQKMSKNPACMVAPVGEQ